MKAILYARYSPRPKASDSIQAQSADLLDWCQKNNHEPLVICFDPDVSGTIPFLERPGLRQALALLRRDYLLVVRNLNRSARSLILGLAVEEEVERLGARLASLEDGGILPWKNEDRNAWCMRAIKYLMADMQRMEGNDRTSRRMRQHQTNGRIMSKRPPYGKRVENGKLVDDAGEQFLLGRIIAMHQDGETSGRIASHLTQQGLTCRGGDWHPKTIRRILKRSSSSHADYQPRG